MNWASARSSRASAPVSTTNRAPDIFAARSKSIWPSPAPISKCSLGVKSNSGLTPTVRKTTLALASSPTGTSSAARLGRPSSSSSSPAANCRTRSSASAWSPSSADTARIIPLTSSPLVLAMPISLDSLLRRAWISWAAVSASRRFSSSAMTRAAVGPTPRALSPASKAAELSRIHLRSNIGNRRRD